MRMFLTVLMKTSCADCVKSTRTRTVPKHLLDNCDKKAPSMSMKRCTDNRENGGASARACLGEK